MNDIKTLATEEIEDDYLLSSVYEIENVMHLVQEIDKRIDHLKGLKKHRTKSIDDQMSKLKQRNDALRRAIHNTMKKLSPDQKTIQFPDVGKVSRRKVAQNWEIEDQDAMLDFFEKEEVIDQAVEIKHVVNTRGVKKLLDQFEGLKVDVPGVKKVPAGESISISFEKDARQKLIEKQEKETPDDFSDLSDLEF